MIWKVKVPLKICNFIWRLLHDSLPTFLTLKNRGIYVQSSCPLCLEEDESPSHLFLFFPFSRAIWHGSSLDKHISNFTYMSIVQCVGQILQLHKDMEQNNMLYLQGVFVTLWTIWTHRNLVVHEGKHPNPMEITLIAQSLTCKYNEAYSNYSTPSYRKSDHLNLNKLPEKP